MTAILSFLAILLSPCPAAGSATSANIDTLAGLRPGMTIDQLQAALGTPLRADTDMMHFEILNGAAKNTLKIKLKQGALRQAWIDFTPPLPAKEASARFGLAKKKLEFFGPMIAHEDHDPSDFVAGAPGEGRKWDFGPDGSARAFFLHDPWKAGKPLKALDRLLKDFQAQLAAAHKTVRHKKGAK